MIKYHTVLVDVGTSHLFGRYTMSETLDLLVDSSNHPVERWAGQQLESGHSESVLYVNQMETT